MNRDLAWLMWVSLAFAAAWSLVLLWAVDGVAVYSTEDLSSDGGATTTGASLADVNGPYAYAVAGVPLFVTVAVALLATFQPHLALALAALGVAGVLGVANLLAMLTVGIFVLPTTGALLLAAILMLARATSRAPSLQGSLPPG